MKTAHILRAGRKKDRFRFILKGTNGNVVARYYPETFTQKHSCIETLQSNFPDFTIVDQTVRK